MGLLIGALVAVVLNLLFQIFFPVASVGLFFAVSVFCGVVGGFFAIYLDN